MRFAILGAMIYCGWLTLALSASSVAAEEPTLGTPVQCELRAVWGGASPRVFDGQIEVEGGTIELVRNLSIQDDSISTLRRQGQNQLLILPHSLSTFGGADIRIRAPLSSWIRFRWRDSAGGELGNPLSVRLQDALSGNWVQPMDSRGSRVAIERPVHDRIRIDLGRAQPIYTAGETCSIRVSGNLTGLAAGEYRMKLRVVDNSTTRAVLTSQHLVDIDANGSFGSLPPTDFAIPEGTGVYTIEVSLQRRRLINSIISSIAIADRKLELVVTDGNSIGTSNEKIEEAVRDWELVAQVYPGDASWWDALGKFKMPTPKLLSPLVSHNARPIGSAEHGRRLVSGQECLVLDAGDWQAFPLQVRDVGQPHRLRIRVPSDKAMNLALSIQEPDAGGATVGLRQDSAIVIDPLSISGAQPEFVEHSVVFWPRTDQPYLLMLNTQEKQIATVSQIEVDVCGEGLPDSESLKNSLPNLVPIRTAEDRDSTKLNSVVSDRIAERRRVSLYMDKPLVAESLGAQRVYDARTQRALDNWQTWVEAASRLAEYTSWSGHNSLTLTVVSQGSAVFPSKTLQPSPKFDSGIFLSDGSCPETKDFVELLCREMDRRDLKLVLALDIEGLLPELARWDDPQQKDPNLFQVDLEGRPWQADDKKDQARLVRYNPLDQRVQNALEHVLREILDRYAAHRCFSGIQLNLSKGSHFNFAGDRWGYDSASLARFEKSIGSRLPTNPNDRQELIHGPLRLNFLSARANELSLFYRRLGEQVARANDSAQLMIHTGKLLSQSPDAESFVAPENANRNAAEYLLSCGIHPQESDADSHVVWLRPEFDAPLRSPIARSWGFQVASDANLDAVMASAWSGCALQQIPTGFRVPEFDAAAVFGENKTRAWLFPIASRGGVAARRQLIHRLFQADQRSIVAGGLTTDMGQERDMRPLLVLLSSLPDRRFSDVSIDGMPGTMVLRRLDSQEQVLFQLVNNASWGQTVELQLESKTPVTLHAWTIAEGQVVSREVRLGPTNREPLTLSVEPYSLSILQIDSTDVAVSELRTQNETNATERLEQRLLDLQACIDRAGELSDQQVLGLTGGDFEEWGVDGKPKGWTASTLPNVSIAEDRELPHSGRSCVRIENSGSEATTAWLQSERIAVPPTGRMAVEVWVRSAPGLEQPGLRVSLVGRHRDGKRFHRWHDFTQPSRQGTQIPVDWGKRPVVLLVPDVPSEELSELNVAVDVVGPGKLWVDDVRVYGMYLHPDEKVHLLGQIFLAKEKLRAGDLAPTHDLLQSYWAYFLKSYLSPAERTENHSSTVSSIKSSATRPESPESVKGQSTTTPSSTPSWRSSSQPRLNQWQENWRNRWQK